MTAWTAPLQTSGDVEMRPVAPTESVASEVKRYQEEVDGKVRAVAATIRNELDVKLQRLGANAGIDPTLMERQLEEQQRECDRKLDVSARMHTQQRQDLERAQRAEVQGHLQSARVDLETQVNAAAPKQVVDHKVGMLRQKLEVSRTQAAAAAPLQAVEDEFACLRQELRAGLALASTSSSTSGEVSEGSVSSAIATLRQEQLDTMKDQATRMAADIQSASSETLAALRADQTAQAQRLAIDRNHGTDASRYLS